MKLIVLVMALCSAFYSNAQVDVKIKIGNENVSFTGHQIFSGNASEQTYYYIEDGVLNYHYLNKYEGNYIQYTHVTCPTKAVNLKKVDYKEYDSMGQFMYLSTKKLNEVVETIELRDADWTVANDPVEKTESTGHSLTFIISTKETGDNLLKKIKKG